MRNMQSIKSIFMGSSPRIRNIIQHLQPEYYYNNEGPTSTRTDYPLIQQIIIDQQQIIRTKMIHRLEKGPPECKQNQDIFAIMLIVTLQIIHKQRKSKAEHLQIKKLLMAFYYWENSQQSQVPEQYSLKDRHYLAFILKILQENPTLPLLTDPFIPPRLRDEFDEVYDEVEEMFHQLQNHMQSTHCHLQFIHHEDAAGFIEQYADEELPVHAKTVHFHPKNQEFQAMSSCIHQKTSIILQEKIMPNHINHYAKKEKEKINQSEAQDEQQQSRLSIANDFSSSAKKQNIEQSLISLDNILKNTSTCRQRYY